MAAELDCAWHSVNDTVVTYCEDLLEADTERFSTATALGLDVLMVRLGPSRIQQFSTQAVDVVRCQLLDVVPDRSSGGPKA